MCKNHCQLTLSLPERQRGCPANLQGSEQVWAAESVIPYILLVVCIVLEVDDVGQVLEEIPAGSYIVCGDMVT